MLEMVDWVLPLVMNAVFAVVCGCLVIRGLRKLQIYRETAEVKQAQQGIRSWPRPFPWLANAIAFLVPITERFVSPSPKISRELSIIERSSEFNDREFLKMRYVSGLLSALMAVVLIGLFYLLGADNSNLTILFLLVLFVLGGFFLPRLLLRDRSNAALARIQRAFPSFLDVFALTLESGQNFQSAFILSVQHLSDSENQPGLKTQLQEVLRSVRAGQSRMQALQQLSDRLSLPEVVQFVASVAASEKQGVSVTALLRRQSEQLRASRALAAERRAMKLPVKLLAPLAICIFPCTFLVLAFPIGVQLSRSGIF
jgi:tight adherence protein C